MHLLVGEYAALLLSLQALRLDGQLLLQRLAQRDPVRYLGLRLGE